MTELRLTNSAGTEKRVFTPVDPDHIRMYVCGPTVYNLVHIGNARPVVVFDTLFRVLQALYPKVTYARNITDIDDKIIVAARERGIDITVLTEEFTEKFRTDMAALNNLPPSIEPQATEHVDAMLDLAQRLIDKGHAYESEGHVLFDVTSMDDYGLLSGRQLDDMLAGQGSKWRLTSATPATLFCGSPRVMMSQVGTAITDVAVLGGISNAPQ